MLKSMKKLGGGKRKPAETVVTYEKKKTTVAPKSISKADTEAKMARIEGMKEEQAELTQGEKDFGSSYKSLGLKGTRRTEMDPKSGEVSVKAKYKSTEGDEEVERIPNSEMLKVKKLGEAAKATDYPEFKETFKERIERLASEKKASGRAKMMAILDAEKRKAQAKAGM
jgi:uncharacterized protein (UPF0335 family)